MEDMVKKYVTGGSAQKNVVLTAPEDAAYDKWMAHFLNEEKTESEAEKETVKILKQSFPRLQELLTGNYKIALEIMAKGGPGVGDVADRPGYEWQEAVVKRFDTKDAAEKWIAKVKDDDESTNHYRIEEVPIKGAINYHVIQKWQGRKLDPRSYEEQATGVIKIGDTVIVNAGRFKDAEGMIVDAGLGSNNYMVEIIEYPKPVKAIVSPWEVKKKVIEKAFDKTLDKLKYTDNKEGLFEAGETVTVKWMGVPAKGVIVEHIPSPTSSDEWRHEYLVKLPGVEEPQCFSQNAIYEAAECAMAKKFWGGVLVSGWEKGGKMSEEEKQVLAMIKRWQKKNGEWKPGTPSFIKKLAAPKFETNNSIPEIDANRYVVDVMYRDCANYKSFAENILVPEEYIKEHGVPQVGGEVDMEKLCFTPNEFYNTIDKIPDDECDHNILEIQEVRRVSEIPRTRIGEVPVIIQGHNKYGDYNAGTFYEKGGNADSVRIEDFVRINSTNKEYNGALGMVLNVGKTDADVELLELPVEGTHLKRTVKKFELEQLTKIENIFDYLKGKSFYVSIPAYPDKFISGPKHEAVVRAGEQEGNQIWVETSDENATAYLLFPDELIGNEFKAGGGAVADMNTGIVEFKGKSYPTRTIVIKGHGLDPTEVTIATEELEKELKKSKYLGKAGKIDEDIYFYVPESLLLVDEKELASNLDEKYEIAEPDEYKDGGPLKGKREHKKKKSVKKAAKHISEPTRFDIRLSKSLAEKAMNVQPRPGFLEKAAIMCEEKGNGKDWIEVLPSDMVAGKLPSVYKTLEIWLTGDLSKEECLDELKKLV